MIEYIILGALLALVFKLGQWYQRYKWFKSMMENTEYWHKVIDLIKHEKSNMPPEERILFEKSPKPKEKQMLHIEQHGINYYAFTMPGDEFIAQASSLEDLAKEVERRRPGHFNFNEAIKIAK